MHLAQVAECYSQGICGIIGAGDFGKPQLQAHHFLNLLLAAGAVIGYSLLYLGWSVFIGWDSSIGCRQDSQGLCSAYGKCRPHVLGYKGLLYCHRIGLVPMDDFLKSMI